MRTSCRIFPSLALVAALASVSWGSPAISRMATGHGGEFSAVPLGAKNLDISFGTLYAWDGTLDVERPAPAAGTSARLWKDVDAGRRLDFSFALAYGLTDFLDLGLMLPYYQDEDDRGKSHGGLGDLRFSVKLNYPTYKHNPIFDLAFFAALDVPTGSDQREGGWARDVWVSPNKRAVSRDVYAQDDDWAPYTAGGPTGIGMVLATLNLRSSPVMMPMLFHGNFGFALGSSDRANAFLFGGGAEIWFCDYAGLLWSMESQMEFGSHTKWFDVASSPYLHKIGLEFAVPQAGVALDVGMVVGTDGMRDSDGERDECAEASNAPRCKGETGDVIDSGDPDYVRTRQDGTDAYKFGRYPTLGFYAGISYLIDFKKFGSVD